MFRLQASVDNPRKYGLIVGDEVVGILELNPGLEDPEDVAERLRFCSKTAEVFARNDTDLTGAGLIVQERLRQVKEKGFDTSHDDLHRRGELAMAALCYLIADSDYSKARNWWPWWGDAPFVPKGRVRDLVRAGALIAAEIDRVQRKDNAEATLLPLEVNRVIDPRNDRLLAIEVIADQPYYLDLGDSPPTMRLGPFPRLSLETEAVRESLYTSEPMFEERRGPVPDINLTAFLKP